MDTHDAVIFLLVVTSMQTLSIWFLWNQIQFVEKLANNLHDRCWALHCATHPETEFSSSNDEPEQPKDDPS